MFESLGQGGWGPGRGTAKPGTQLRRTQGESAVVRPCGSITSPFPSIRKGNLVRWPDNAERFHVPHSASQNYLISCQLSIDILAIQIGSFPGIPSGR